MKTYKAHCIYGYYEEYKMVSVDKRLKYCPYGQCGVIFGQYITNNNITVNTIELISYESRVLVLHKEHHMLVINGDCIEALATFSATTRKHVNAFLEEYVPNITYHDIKAALKRNECVIEC